MLRDNLYSDIACFPYGAKNELNFSHFLVMINFARALAKILNQYAVVS
jgi:hypothetical protein